MSEQENRRLVQESFDAFHAYDAGQFAALLDETYVWESDTLPAPLTGREAARQGAQIYLTAFPDLHFDIEQMITRDEYVVTRWRATGTHQGEFIGIAPTHQQAITHGCTVNEVKNGKVTHAWVYWNLAHVLQAMGVLPQMGA